MKRIITFLLALSGLATAFAQTPQAVCYQGVATDQQGRELISQNIRVRLSILKTSASGAEEWVENHSVTTDGFGLFDLPIGLGMRTGGAQTVFSNIKWGLDRYYLKVEMDITGGTNYVLMGVNQLISVPYALYSDKTGVADSAIASSRSVTSITANTANYSNTSGRSLTSGRSDTATFAWLADSARRAATAGFATNAGNANYALNAGRALTAGRSDTAQFAWLADSARRAATAGFATNAGNANYAINAGRALTAGRSDTAQFAWLADSARRAATAGFATNAQNAVNAQTAQTAVNATNAQNAVNSLNAVNAQTAVRAISAGRSDTAQFAWLADSARRAATAGFATNAQNAVNAQQALTALDDRDRDPLNEIQTMSFDTATSTLKLTKPNGLHDLVSFNGTPLRAPGASIDFPYGVLGEAILITSNYVVPSGKTLFINAANNPIILNDGRRLNIEPGMPILPSGSMIATCFCSGILVKTEAYAEPIILDFASPGFEYTVQTGKTFVIKSGTNDSRDMSFVVDGTNYSFYTGSSASPRLVMIPEGKTMRRGLTNVGTSFVVTGYLLKKIP